MTGEGRSPPPLSDPSRADCRQSNGQRPHLRPWHGARGETATPKVTFLLIMLFFSSQWVTLSPSTIPYSYLGLFGDFLRYLVDNYHKWVCYG